MIRFILFLLTPCFILQLSGCGGGGTSAPTKATVTLSTVGTLPSDKLIGDIEITLNLPAGVTVKASPSLVNPSIMIPNDGVIELQGAAATAANQIITATYAQGINNKIVIKLINANGLGIGNFAKINCDVVNGNSPSSNEISITPDVASTTGVFDLNTSALPEVQVSSSMVMQ